MPFLLLAGLGKLRETAGKIFRCGILEDQTCEVLTRSADKFTYIKTNAPEKFSVYEMKDGKPNLISYDLREGTYVIPKVMNSGYVELGKKRMEFSRKG